MYIYDEISPEKMFSYLQPRYSNLTTALTTDLTPALNFRHTYWQSTMEYDLDEWVALDLLPSIEPIIEWSIPVAVPFDSQWSPDRSTSPTKFFAVSPPQYTAESPIPSRWTSAALSPEYMPATPSFEAQHQASLSPEFTPETPTWASQDQVLLSPEWSPETPALVPQDQASLSSGFAPEASTSTSCQRSLSPSPSSALESAWAVDPPRQYDVRPLPQYNVRPFSKYNVLPPLPPREYDITLPPLSSIVASRPRTYDVLPPGIHSTQRPDTLAPLPDWPAPEQGDRLEQGSWLLCHNSIPGAQTASSGYLSREGWWK
ncbi:hypothetical protein H2200_001616 [Cladophialophora chaetospira]|uniref:Uncharacterized protein n=1 Tax=Cladophialophora chaetospira TaxID=386627 RepID=A0AA38XLB5_9EURO|nr:hypothetical protein H2200_001616 [Cladophialophora chaetospira]